ncbi:hypothetical protein [Corynebacterium guangdongense]|uniref:Flagellar biosynthesis/type III secretory pathway protein FliH n=1 Tax=Corynebacterium guangdongense TaxID=1783348 RepID=A0ABU1ZUZ2_9CORY|nr:hypothetical protein [Corynebacterium guangdongense]MDR7328742.1 flagellar biosynthesis/type III secretory pathway protein FliH [Corynebacterium guangdongense]WJZ17318.1 Chromosome partition protein Smc [Corynebacterium guangdongense]
MTDKGRAAFNARHLRHGTGHAKGTSGTTGDRQRLLEEMMRELEEKWAKHHATKNPNIVLDETHLNESFMFDPDTGGWRTPESVDEVVAYGDDRAAQVGRKIGATSFETTTLVVHLPRTLCTEVPGYYPVHDEDGQIKLDKDGNELRRSRWVARDRAEATRYLIAATEWLADNVLPGGREAVHGFNVQHDESTPHVQIMADTFAEHPEKPGVLRVEASQAWGSHRDVRYPEDHPQAGQQMGGPQKMRMYQQGLREYMRSLGYEVELEVSERAHESLDKDRYAAEDNARRALEADQQALAADREKYTADATVLGMAQRNFDSDVALFKADIEKLRVAREEVDVDMTNVLAFSDKLDEVKEELDDRQNAVTAREETVETRERAVEAKEASLPELKRKAREEGHAAGKSEGLQAAQEAVQEAAAKIKAQAATDAQRVAQQAAEAAQRVRHDAEAAAAEKRAQADQAVADAAAYRARAQDALAEAEQKLTAAAEEAAIMRQEAERDKATAHTDGFTQGFRQGQGKFNESVADLLTRDGGEKRITVELIRALSGGSQDRIDQARTQVMSKLRRQAEATLTIGTPVRPTQQRIEAKTRQTADAPVTDPEQVRRLMTTSPATGRGPSHGLSKGKGTGPQFGG